MAKIDNFSQAWSQWKYIQLKLLLVIKLTLILDYKKTPPSSLCAMKNKQIRVIRESTSLIKIQNQQIFQYSNEWGNHILICSRYIDFNRNLLYYDRNSITYFAAFTSDACFAVIFTRDPFSVHVLNLKSGQVFVARGFDQFVNYKVLCVSVQPEQGMKAGHNTRKINVIYQNRGNVYFKIIQMTPKIDSDPKSRTKPIQQNSGYRMNNVQCAPVFSTINWNNFIFCRKQMRVCKALNKNDQITFNFAIQAFQPQLNQLFDRFNIIGMAQTNQSWAILCGNAPNSRNDQNMMLNIFWQHQPNNELSRNMYFRDNSFIKSVDLPNTEKQFIKLWHIKTFYLIQTQNKNQNRHSLFVIPQQSDYGLMTVDLSPNSEICQHSLTANSSQLSICEIINKNQLSMIKLYEKQMQMQQSLSNQQRQTQIQTTKYQTQQRVEIKQVQTSIKQFMVVDQQKVQQDDISNENKKNTVKRNQTTVKQEIKVEQTKKFINEKIVHHLSKAQAQKRQQIKSDDLQVPSKLQSLVSFGAPNPNRQIHNSSILDSTQKIPTKNHQNDPSISFGAPQIGNANLTTVNSIPNISQNKLQLKLQQQDKNVKTDKEKSKSNEKDKDKDKDKDKQRMKPIQKDKQKKIIEANIRLSINSTQAMQIICFTRTFSNKLEQQLNTRSVQVSKNFPRQKIHQTIKFESILNQQQLFKLIQGLKSLENFEIEIQNQNIRNQLQQTKKNEICKRVEQNMKSIENWSDKLRINLNDNISQFNYLRKFLKPTKILKLQQETNKNLQVLGIKVTELEQISKQLLLRIQKQKESQKKQSLQKKSSLRLKKITELLNAPTNKKIIKNDMRMPIPRVLYAQIKGPVVELQNL